jgi:hypothetical protein
MEEKAWCPAPEGQLLAQGFNLTAVANTTTSANFTAPTGRGIIKRLSPTVGSNTTADLAASTVTIIVNGIEVIKNANLIYFSSAYQNRKEFDVQIPEAATFNVSVTNGSANAIPFELNAEFV